MTEKQTDNLNIPTNEESHNSKLRGISELSFDAIHGVTNIVESLHGAIQTQFLIPESKVSSETTQGITGFIYKNIRYMTSLVGVGVDKVLESIEKLVVSDSQYNKISYSREAILSALNGVIGDHLAAKNNPLAIKMQFRYHGQVVAESELLDLIRASNDKLLLMIHGLCMNDLQWTKLDHNHGEELAAELGYTPIYLHYNTGLHVSENGQLLADLLERIQSKSGSSFELNILAHSMGGLLIRSASEQAQENNMNWTAHLKTVVFLGTPHHGAHLERLGSWLDNTLSLSPYTKPFSKIGKIRSSGITDLRYGNVMESDWNGEERFENSGDLRTPVPLLDSVDYYAIAATNTDKSNNVKDKLIGDGLVTITSAFGQHKKTEFNLNFNKSNTFIIQQTSHMQLLSDIRVYQQINEWFSE